MVFQLYKNTINEVNGSDWLNELNEAKKDKRL